MKRLQLLSVPVIVTLASLFAAGCGGGDVQVRANVPAPTVGVAVATPGVVVEAPPQEVVVATRPPPEQVEVITVAPSTNHLWIKGHWHWNGGAWVWNPGHWEVRRVGLQWYPAHYADRGGGIVYVPGHWGR